MLKFLFGCIYRIKKVSVPRDSKNYNICYYLQFKRRIYPIWLLICTGHEHDKNSIKRRMEDYIARANQKKRVVTVYHTEEVPDHIPKEQEDAYLVERNKYYSGNLLKERR